MIGNDPGKKPPVPVWFALTATVGVVVAIAWTMVLMRLMWAAGTWLLRG